MKIKINVIIGSLNILAGKLNKRYFFEVGGSNLALVQRSREWFVLRHLLKIHCESSSIILQNLLPQK